METIDRGDIMPEPVDAAGERPAALTADETAVAILEQARPIKAGTYTGTDGRSTSYRLTHFEGDVLEQRHLMLADLGNETLTALAGVPELQVASTKAFLKNELGHSWPEVKFKKGGKNWKLTMHPALGAFPGGFDLEIGKDSYEYQGDFRSDLGGNRITTKINGDPQTNSPEAYRGFKALIASVKPPQVTA